MAKPYYFGSGPATFPPSVLEEIQAEWLDCQGTGLSILELGHRSSAFEAILSQLTQLLRTLLAIPEAYHVIWLGVPARAHFGLIPLHFLQRGETAGYWVTGTWSRIAFEEAKRFKQPYCIASSEAQSFYDVPHPSTWVAAKKTAYVYVTPNETIQGVRFHPPADWCEAPLVADMTSCLLSEPIEVSQYGLIFAGTQKNMGPAGLSVFIISPEMMAKASSKNIPTALSYPLTAQHHSLQVTPPVFQCYVVLKMLQWIEANGGLGAMRQHARQKSTALYAAIDASRLFENKVAQHVRSWLNIPFQLAEQQLESLFIKQAAAQGLIGLAGHRSLGGVRASLYNAMPFEGVTALIDFMQWFEAERIRSCVPQ